MSLLNKPIYEVDKDRLIYDAKHPIDAIIVQVSVPENTAGTIKRGQVIDHADGVYSIHASEGTPSMIAAEETSYAADDTSVPVTVYISGNFRASEVIADPEMTTEDMEALRGKGICLK